MTSPFKELVNGLGEGDGLRMPLMGLDADDGVAEAVGEGLASWDPSVGWAGSLYCVWADHSTFFLVRPEPVLGSVIADDAEPAFGGVWRLSRGSKGADLVEGADPLAAWRARFVSRGGVGGRADSEAK